MMPGPMGSPSGPMAGSGIVNRAPTRWWLLIPKPKRWKPFASPPPRRSCATWRPTAPGIVSGWPSAGRVGWARFSWRASGRLAAAAQETLVLALPIAYLCNMQSPNIVALAFSGGLDTSFCVAHLRERGWTVHTIHVDTGGSSAADRDGIRRQAEAVGAAQHHDVDARSEVYDRFVRFLIQGNVLRGEVYPLSVAGERTQQAMSVAALAREIGVAAVAHGSTGAGNDQVRFDVALRVLAPELEIIAPIRDDGVRREQAIAYLAARGLPVPKNASTYSVNRGLWGTTWGGAWTHDAWAGPPDELIDSPADAPLKGEIVLEWRRGEPVALDGEALAGPELVQRLGALSANYG